MEIGIKRSGRTENRDETQRSGFGAERRSDGADELSALAGSEGSAVRDDEGQALKSTRGMPWHQEPMKDVTSCDKLRGAANEL